MDQDTSKFYFLEVNTRLQVSKAWLGTGRPCRTKWSEVFIWVFTMASQSTAVIHRLCLETHMLQCQNMDQRKYTFSAASPASSDMGKSAREVFVIGGFFHGLKMATDFFNARWSMASRRWFLGWTWWIGRCSFRCRA